jgi:hypothetical protein
MRLNISAPIFGSKLKANTSIPVGRPLFSDPDALELSSDRYQPSLQKTESSVLGLLTGILKEKANVLLETELGDGIRYWHVLAALCEVAEKKLQKQQEEYDAKLEAYQQKNWFYRRFKKPPEPPSGKVVTDIYVNRPEEMAHYFPKELDTGNVLAEKLTSLHLVEKPYDERALYRVTPLGYEVYRRYRQKMLNG